MALKDILFFSKETSYVLKQKQKVREWVAGCIQEEGFRRVAELNIILCDDAYLLEINQQYLNHDTYTDIVTFDNSEEEDVIMGDIFISVDRTQENASKFGVTAIDELHRVIIHGVLHLCGYLDKSKADKTLMTEKEDYYLAKRSF